MIWYFLIFLAISLIFGLGVRSGKFRIDSERDWEAATIVLAMIDTVLVVIALNHLWETIPPFQTVSTKRQIAVWLGSIPILGLTLVLNRVFFEYLRDLFHLESELYLDPLSVLSITLMCIQPAIIEELFFRHLILGILRRHVSGHGAVFISGVMFGLAHVYNPLGMPYLILLGVILGYLRIGSQSLLLPMILHFAHNLVVIHPWFQ